MRFCMTHEKITFSRSVVKMCNLMPAKFSQFIPCFVTLLAYADSDRRDFWQQVNTYRKGLMEFLVTNRLEPEVKHL
jgi:hypothetical protein